MGSVIASTWAGVVSGNSNFTDNHNTMYLGADIDLNDEYPQGIDTLILNVGGGQTSASRSWTIDGKVSTTGKNYVIRNLRTKISNPVPLFKMNYANYASCTVTFKNIDFVNCILSGADFYTCGHTGNNNAYKLIFENCRFVGYRTGNAFLIRNNCRSIQVTSCYFDMPWYAANQDLTALNCTSLVSPLTGQQITDDGANLPVAYYCWFHESYGGWYLHSDTSGENPSNDLCTNQGAMFCMNGCYVDGEMKRAVSIWNNGPMKNVYFYCDAYQRQLGTAFTASTPNVIDMRWYTDESGSNSSRHGYVANMNAVFKKDLTFANVVPSDWNTVAVGSQPSPILATPEQMKDVSWLRSQGFPIIEDTPSE